MLSTFIWIPILGALILSLLPADTTAKRCRDISIVLAAGVLLWTIWLAIQFEPGNVNLQFEENLPWIDWLGLNYHLGLDGLSLPLIFLNSLLTLLAICCTSKIIERPRFYFAMLLLLSAGAAGAFLAQDLLLFFLFYKLFLNHDQFDTNYFLSSWIIMVF